jgi:hypothetical protein
MSSHLRSPALAPLAGNLRSPALALLAGNLRPPALALLAGAFVFAGALPALADEQPPAQTRATIRGTGNDVSIVYKGVTEKAPKHHVTAGAKLSGGPASSQPDLLSEATRMAEHGADDQSLINYFQTHQNALPDIVDNDAVRRLRKAGAGTAVVTYLSHLSAVDIGETAEGSPQQYAYANEGPGDYSSEYPSADMGYPYGSYGGYGGNGSGGFHHGRRFVGKKGPGFGLGFGKTLPVFPAHPIVSPRPMASMGGHGGGAHVGTFRRNP